MTITVVTVLTALIISFFLILNRAKTIKMG